MKKTYHAPGVDVARTKPFVLLAGSDTTTIRTSSGETLKFSTTNDGAGDPSSFANQGLWEEE